MLLLCLHAHKLVECSLSSKLTGFWVLRFLQPQTAQVALGIIQSFIEVQHPAQFTGDSSISAVGAKESDTVRFQHRQLTVQHVSAGPTTEPRRTTSPAVYMKTHTHMLTPQRCTALQKSLYFLESVVRSSQCLQTQRGFIL